MTVNRLLLFKRHEIDKQQIRSERKSEISRLNGLRKVLEIRIQNGRKEPSVVRIA